MGSAAAAGRRLGTLQAGRSGRGGCERAPSVPARLARVSGEASAARRPGNLQLSPAARGALCSGGGDGGGGSESHPLAAERQGREEGGGGGDRGDSARPTPSARAHLPGALQSPLSACTRPRPRPGLPATPRPPRLQPFARLGPPGSAPATRSRRRVCGERGRRRRLDAPGAASAPQPCWNSPGERRGQPGRASGRRGDSAGPGDGERAGEEERAEEQAPGADTMPGWKKNIPICLQAEEQGER